MVSTWESGSRSRTVGLVARFSGAAVLGLVAAGCQSTPTVGPLVAGGQRVPTGQLLFPAGRQIEFSGRPVDLTLASKGDALLVKDNRGLVVIDAATGALRQELEIPGGTSMRGIAVAEDGSVWLSGAGSTLVQAVPDRDGRYRIRRTVELPRPSIGGEAHPCGFAIEGSIAWVCLSRNNALAKVNLETGRTENLIPVDVCPFEVVVDRSTSKAYVSCWGGPSPKGDRAKADSGGTDVEVDERGVARSGTVVAVDLRAGRQVARLPVGLQPSELVLTRDGRRLFVANASSDSLVIIDRPSFRVCETLVTHPEPGQLFGSAPNALALSPDEARLYVALGGNNAVAVVELGNPSRMCGLIPVGWYPGAVTISGRRIFAANVKGVGSRAGPREGGGHSVYDFRGSVSVVDMPEADVLAEYTRRAKRNARVFEGLRALDRAAAARAPKPVPDRAGDPSPIKHVVYILKENRTYDQVFGDLPQGDGDPRLCMFPRKTTPNHHALAEQFVLLDNYYCNGVNSADGHSWAMEGNATSYLERSFGGWTRSYPFGDDALAYSSSGFIWDNVLAAGLTFRNYGEFVYSEPHPSSTFKQIYDAFINKTGELRFSQKIGVERARLYANPDYPGWNMAIPDVLRADVFLKELRKFEKEGTFPNFTIVYLPQDHNSGTQSGMPTPRAHMADNDLALGRIVEALSMSRFWPRMAIFVNEDDPQNGFDHVDGHRSICLVISPYAKRRQVISDFYNQTSVLHTMERMLGLPPMNQMDAMAPPMSSCFTDRIDVTPYTCLPNIVPLDEVNPQKAALRGEALRWSRASDRLDLSRPDAGNDDLRNRILWWSVKGALSYPSALVGAHGKGLQGRGLTTAGARDD